LDVTFASNERRASAGGRGDSSPFMTSFQTDKYLLSNDQLYNVAQGQGILNEEEDYNQLKSYLEQLSSLTHLSQDNID